MSNVKYKLTSLLLLFIGLLQLTAVNVSYAVGNMPVPTLNGVTINVNVTDVTPPTDYYPTIKYEYAISNPASNTGNIWRFQVDMLQDFIAYSLGSGVLRIQFNGYDEYFSNMYYERRDLLPKNKYIIPFGQQVPYEWVGGFGASGYAEFAAGTDVPMIAPGTSQSGFVIYSRTAPAIRKVRVIPDWLLVVDDHDNVTDKMLSDAAVVERNMVYETYSVGPAPEFQTASLAHWNFLRDQIPLANQLGWISDVALISTLQQTLALARAGVNPDDATVIITNLQMLINIVDAADLTVMNNNAKLLIKINAQLLMSHYQNRSNSPIPKIEIVDQGNILPVTERYVIKVKMYDEANDNIPFERGYVELMITDGPGMGYYAYKETDPNGEATFEYTGTGVGKDTFDVTTGVWIPTDDGYTSFPSQLEVTWTGGADMVIAHFGPNIIETKAGNDIYLTDVLANIGTINATASTVRFYMHPQGTSFNPVTASVIAEYRSTQTLADEFKPPRTQVYQVPGNLSEGVYNVVACADALNEIPEIDEKNNCSNVQVASIASTSVSIVGLGNTNTPPDCSGAVPSINTIWPPNHKFVDIGISGVIDSDGDTVTIKVVSIYQDEPVDDLGDGNFSADAMGTGTAYAQVRAERSGLGNGRAYVINFEGRDDKDATCTGSVSIGVPHDIKDTVINDGAVYDSTKKQ